MNRIGQYADMVKVAEMFRNGLNAENSSNLDQYSLANCVTVRLPRVFAAGKRKEGHDVQATFAISERWQTIFCSEKF